MEHLPMIGSNHTPLLINTNPRPTSNMKRKLRFNMAWCTHEDFYKLVHKTWISKLELGQNVLLMANALTEGNKCTLGNIFYKKKKLLARIGGIQCSIAHRARSDLFRLDRKLRFQLDETLYQEKLLWYQRPREEWITSGDQNTRYYQLSTMVKNITAKIKTMRNEEGK